MKMHKTDRSLKNLWKGHSHRHRHLHRQIDEDRKFSKCGFEEKRGLTDKTISQQMSRKEDILKDINGVVNING